MNARLAYLSIHVRSVPACRRFYTDLLGLPVVSDEEWGCVLDAGGIQLFLHPRGGDEPRPVELTFDVDDADAAVADLTSRGAPLSEPVVERSGVTATAPSSTRTATSSTCVRRGARRGV